MFTKIKSALYNVVGNFDPTDGGATTSSGIVSLTSGAQNTPSLQPNTIQGKEKVHRFPYTRPQFLQLNTEDEILVSADHTLRPIICPRDISRIPWNSGYAETVNAGKSKRNEDQAAIHVCSLSRSNAQSNNSYSTSASHIAKAKGSSQRVSSVLNGVIQDGKEETEDPLNNSFPGKQTLNSPPEPLDASNLPDPLNSNSTVSYPPLTCHSDGVLGNKQQNERSLPYFYFAVFDGHAGWGAAVSAANQLHHILHEKLCNVIELIIPREENDNSELRGPLWPHEKIISPEKAVIGALEQAFWTMDQQIGEDRQRHNLSGGCTACVALFILGKVFVSNAGDSRGVIAFKGTPVSMSFDFTPETETQRIRKIGARHPELLGGEFTHLEFLRRPLKSDVGKKAAYRDHYMKGWSLKTITEADLKYPLVCGEGKRSRVLATIGVTRGFGDHDLKAQFSSLPIKPFLSPEPEVRVFELMNANLTDRDVLILGTDGLWDIMSNEKAVSTVTESLQQFSHNDSNRYKYRYTSAAHDLVLWSRGRLKEHNWRTADDKHATIDDISVFVIPLKPYKEEFILWRRRLSAVDSSEEVFEKSLRENIPMNTTHSSHPLSNRVTLGQSVLCDSLPCQSTSSQRPVVVGNSGLIPDENQALTTASTESIPCEISGTTTAPVSTGTTFLPDTASSSASSDIVSKAESVPSDADYNTPIEGMESDACNTISHPLSKECFPPLDNKETPSSSDDVAASVTSSDSVTTSGRDISSATGDPLSAFLNSANPSTPSPSLQEAETTCIDEAVSSKNGN